VKKWKRRIATAWKVLMGKQCLLTDAATQIVYVRDSGPDGKIIQLVPWRDQILALDNNGSILIIEAGYDRELFPKFQLWMQEPRVPSRRTT
jgi:hypothetical protein